MEYKDSSRLKVVTGHQSGQGISEFINKTLHATPKGQACPMWELAKEVRDKFPHINKMQSYVRVNMVLKRAGNKGKFIKFADASDYLLIGWAADRRAEGDAGEEERHDADVIDNTEETWVEQE